MPLQKQKHLKSLQAFVWLNLPPCGSSFSTIEKKQCTRVVIGTRRSHKKHKMLFITKVLLRPKPYDLLVSAARVSLCSHKVLID